MHHARYNIHVSFFDFFEGEHRREADMKKALGYIWLGITLLLAIALLFVTLGGIYLLPYSQVKMDLSLLPTMCNGAPAKLYAQASKDRGLGRTYLPVEDALPVYPASYVAVTYDSLPEHLVNAFVAIEDKRFFEHRGIDLRRTGQAALNYLLGKEQTFGGSTITQQLVKNVTRRDERTPNRKLTEIFSAVDMEKQLCKEEILEAYLNVINLGGGCRGVGAAARYYFDKEISALTLTECACIAAITNNPSYYDPSRHPQNNLERRNLILEEMCKQGYISREMCDTAQSSPTSLHISQQPDSATSSWYADMVTKDVIADLQTRLGYTLDQATALVYHGDLIIETAMDTQLQSILSAYYEDLSHFPKGEAGYPQSAMMILDPLSGDILAVAGAIGEKTGFRIQNYATDTKRPAGSAIKPLSVYAPALELGIIDFASVYNDQPLKSINGSPWPRNADGLYRGKLTVREAVALSTNTVAVKLLNEIGLSTSFDFLRHRLGMTSLIPADKKTLHDLTEASLALGQQSRGVSLRELLGGYTICYEGVFHKPVSYHRVLTATGEVLLSNTGEGETVLSRENACILNHLLQGVTADGTAASLTLGQRMGLPIAGKTGTTQNNCDRWFVGLTPRLAAAVWMGYEYPQEMRGIDKNPCLDIWDEVMLACEETYEGRPRVADFPACPSVIPITVCPHSGEIATEDCRRALPTDNSRIRPFVGWFDVSRLPSGDCSLHKSEDTSDTADVNDMQDQS